MESPESSIRTSLLPSDSENEFEEFAPNRVQHPPPRPPPLYPEEDTKPLKIAAAWALVFFLALVCLPVFLIPRPHVGQLPTSRKSASMAAFTNDAALGILNPSYPNLKNSGLNSSTDILLVYSGMGHNRRLLNDTFAFDLQTRQWIRVLPGEHETKEIHPDPRWKSAAVSIPMQGLLVLFGDAMQHVGGGSSHRGGGSFVGKDGGEEAGKKFDNDVWMLELPKLKWQTANFTTTKGKAVPSVVPQARRGHSVNLIAASTSPKPLKPTKDTQETTLILFGGVSSEGEELNDTWKASISWPNITWTQLGALHSLLATAITEEKSLSIRPLPRHGHATAILETSTEVLSSQRLQKTLENGNLEENSKLHQNNILKDDEEKEEAIQRKYMVVFGGRDQTQFFNDLWLLNIDKTDTIPSGGSRDKKTTEWVLYPIDGSSPIPPPRAHHTIAIYEDKLYLWGGLSGPRVEFAKPLDDLWVFSFEHRRWYKLNKHGAWPLPRFLFSSVVHQPQGALEPRLYIFGGESLDRCKLNDLWSLNLKTLMWSQLTPNYFARQRCDKLFGGHQ